MLQDLAGDAPVEQRLVRQRLVTRETDPVSRRRIRLTISAAGLVSLGAAEPRTTEWLVQILGSLDPRRLAALVDGLHDLRALLGQDDEAPAASP